MARSLKHKKIRKMSDVKKIVISNKIKTDKDVSIRNSSEWEQTIKFKNHIPWVSVKFIKRLIRYTSEI